MGYHVYIHDVVSKSDCIIKTENFEAAYKALCELNSNPDYDVLKSGKVMPGGNEPRIEGESFHRARWYSWTSFDYHLKCKTLDEVLSEFGFEAFIGAEGLLSLNYSNKTGNEDILLCALAPFIEDGVGIEWIGEDDTRWKHVFKDKKMFFHKSKVVYQIQGQQVSIEGHVRDSNKMNKLYSSITESLSQ